MFLQFLHLVQTLPRVRELYFQNNAKKNENDHKSWGCIHACTCWIETSWLFSFSPCPFLLHVYSLFLSFVISYFRSNSIRSYIILNVSFSSNRRWKVDGWKLLTIMDFVSFSTKSIISFLRILRAFVSLVFYRLDEIRMSESREKSSAIYEVSFGTHGIVQRFSLRKCWNGIKSCCYVLEVLVNFLW